MPVKELESATCMYNLKFYLDNLLTPEEERELSGYLLVSTSLQYGLTALEMQLRYERKTSVPQWEEYQTAWQD
jgi:hypothetical protein